MKGLQDWKEFYGKERESMQDEVARASIRSWENRSNGENSQKVRNALKREGVISFGHPFLKDNLEFYLDICKSLYMEGKSKIVLVGVLHSKDSKDIGSEFSLDNFEFVLEKYAEANNLEPLKVVKEFFPPLPSKELDFGEYLSELKPIARKIGYLKDEQTAVLITGDLSHYGYGYGTKKINQNYEGFVLEKIKNCMKTLYEDRNYEEFKRKSGNIGNDQISPAIITKEILGEGLNFEIVDYVISDYSGVLNSQNLSVVFSLLYSVSKSS